ncbi:MAG: hypothetical protein LLF96_03695 [Eubacteriales bacterium]|nr:hypothetical protein [Eubacteriales bacterium]
MEANYGCAMCLCMFMMGMKGLPTACETDVMGAVSMLALLKASGVPPMYQDWDNNYKDEPNNALMSIAPIIWPALLRKSWRLPTWIFWRQRWEPTYPLGRLRDA